MLQLVADTRETLSYRLPALFEFVEKARKQGAFALATKAGGLLLAYALNEDPSERHMTVRIATTDLYGDASGETKYDLVVLKYLPNPRWRVSIPVPLLTLDAVGRCYRRAGELERRSLPVRRAKPPLRPTDAEMARLTAEYTKLVHRDGNLIRNVLQDY